MIEMLRNNLSKDRLCRYLELIDDSFSPSLSDRINLDVFAEKLIKHGEIISIVENDDVLAGIGFYANDQNEYQAYVTFISVNKQYRRLGYADKLINEAMVVAKEKKMKKMALSVKKDNIGAVNLYKKHGFIVKGQERGRLNMTKELK